VKGKIRLGVIFGGRSGEHEVSLMSARSVLNALDKSKYEIVTIGISHEGHWYAGQGILEALASEALQGFARVAVLGEPGECNLYRWSAGSPLEVLGRLDAVLPLLHGTFGEDGTIQGLFEMAEVPYVGAGVLASSVAMDKGLFKMLMQAHGIPTVESVVVLSSEISSDIDAAIAKAESVSPYPLFVKPANLGSSVGISKVRNRSDLLEGLMEAARYDRRVLIERGLDAREIEVSVLGNEAPEASAPGEIIPSDEFYSYRAKYIDDRSELIIPAPVPAQVAERARRLAVETFRVIDGAGMARVDFLLERSTGELFVNEANTIPGFTKISMYPKLWEASGLTYPSLLDRLVDLAFERYAQKAKLVRSYEAAT
jgi:D-alanine-D-alanine ligase